MIKRFLWPLLLASGLQTSWAYSLGGPIANGGDSWQNVVIGYGEGGDLNAPKNYGEEYRRNVPVVYYAFDATFLDYFGADGATNIDGAFTILNASLTNVDGYSSTLGEFPIETRHVNYSAQALGLYDLKSFTLGVMTEQLGLADPIRYDWTLHDRYLPPGGTCPISEEYLVVQRNFDVTPTKASQLQYSPYVNNTLYSYQILEICTGNPTLATSIPYAVDPLADTYSPVASSIGGLMYIPVQIGSQTLLLPTVVPGIDSYGYYYTGLTKDDMGGLRYLLSTNTVLWETADTNSTLIEGITNTISQQVFPVATGTNNGYLYNGVFYGTSSLYSLLSFASTNNAAAIQAQFPGIQANLISSYFTNILVTNVVSYFTNYIGSPSGSPPILVTVTNVTPGFTQFFVYTFSNLITNSFSSNTTYSVQTITVGPLNGAPAGSPSVTNTVTKTLTTPIPSGDFYILPTNGPCGVDILSTLLTFTNYTTNVITSATTNGASTNVIFSSTQIQIIPSVSHVFTIFPITCEQIAAPTGLYEGIGKMNFVRADFDSLVGQYWQPVTNNYTMVVHTNSQAIRQNFQRIATQPDYVFSALDIASPNAAEIGSAILRRNLNFNQGNVPAGLAGPGTITSPTVVSFNKVGPVFFNTPLDVMNGTPYFTESPGGDVSDLFYAPYFIWASFDGTTNAPEVYPNGTSIQNLQNEMLVQVTPTTVPNGNTGALYNPPGVTFTATGGSFTRPFTWTATGLPPGLSITSNADSTGTLSGTPTQAGSFDFTLILTDSLGRLVQWTYPITIN